MGITNAVFFLNLKTLNKKTDEKLKRFLKSEDLEEKEVVDIIYNEAQRIGLDDRVKVTFKMIDDDEDSFRIIVEPEIAKYVGTVIYPYDKIKSRDFEFILDSVCSKITLCNMKKESKKVSVTIDSIGLDIFAMSYQKAKDFLKNLSDKKEKNGYIEFPDAICFKNFGIKLNAKKDESGNLKPDELVESIDVYNSDEFSKEYYFEEIEEKYDVNIPLPDEYNYEKKENENKQDAIVDAHSVDLSEQKGIDDNLENDIEIEIELPEQERVEENAGQDDNIIKIEEIKSKEDKAQEELDKIRQKQDLELEKVKEKLKRELEEEINKNIQNYDLQNEKRMQEEMTKEENEPLDLDEENDIAAFEEIENNEDEKVEIQDQEETHQPTKTELEIKELEKMLEEERQQQKILEQRIVSKLEELKNVAKESKNNLQINEEQLTNIAKPEILDTREEVINNDNVEVAYEIESYQGIRLQGEDDLAVYFDEDKREIRNYFGGKPDIKQYEEMEMYDIFYAYYDDDDKCTGIGIYNKEEYATKVGLYIFGHNLITMTYREIVRLIKKNDYKAIEDDDGIISLKYGISVDPRETKNYKDEIGEVIHIFKKGYYDDVYQNF